MRVFFLCRALFLHLFIPLVQRILDSFTLERNFSRIAKSKHSNVPTGVSPEVCHHNPEKYDGYDGGVEVPKDLVQGMIAHYYPDEETLFQISPPIFAATVSQVIADLGYLESHITLNDVWKIFQEVLVILKQVDVDLDEFPRGVLNVEGEYEEFNRDNRFDVRGDDSTA